MNDQINDGESLGSLDGVSASNDTQASSPEATTQNSQQDLIKNLKAEMNRKFSKINDIKSQVDLLVNFIGQQQQPTGTVSDDKSNADPVVQYVEKRFQEQDKKAIDAQHKRDFQEAVTKFPELDENSDQYDPKFYDMVDKLFGKRQGNDPEALKEAVEIAAVRMGKIERLTQDKLLKDEARRSRLIAEGTNAPREGRGKTEATVDEKALQRLGIDPAKFKKRLKDEKYQGGK